MDKPRRPLVVDLLAQTVDIDFDEIHLAVEMAVPHVLDNFAARDKLGRAKQQELEERKFLACKWDHFLAAAGAAAVTVELEVSVTKLRVAAMESAPHQRPDTREKLREHKRFC